MRKQWVKSCVVALLTQFIFLGGMAEAADGGVGIAFPEGFWWGTSLAGHQAEGGNDDNWTRWEMASGHIRNGDRSGRADDHWNRYEKDFDELVWLGANTHRMSVEWSRIEPRDGIWDAQAIAHYRAMIHALKKRGIRPVICLFHFTMPTWMEDQGGFESARGVSAYIAFVAKVQGAFGDLVHDWLTMNEPMVYVVNGYQKGIFPPGVRDIPRSVRVMANLMHAHAEAYRLIKQRDPSASVSFAQHMRIFDPARLYDPLDWWGARTVDRFFNWAWFDAIQTGRIRISVPTIVSLEEECPECKGSLDYIGVNYYTRDLIAVHPFSKNPFETRVPPGAPTTDLGWEIYPDGLRRLMRAIRDRGLGRYPIVITENGIADASDSRRSRFIYDHLRTFLESARDLGLRAKGYLHWTLMDNFEWAEGFSPRFGLLGVDYATLARSRRKSAEYFRDLGKAKRLFPPLE